MSDELNIKMVPFKRTTVEAVDMIVEVAKKNGSKDRVETEADWRTVETIYKIYTIMYPGDYQRFIESIKYFRENNAKHGIANEKDAAIQHQIELPTAFYNMMNVIFPLQKWDRDFIFKLARKLPEIKAIGDSF